MEFTGYVYALIDGTDDSEYVGQTTKTVEERFKQHTQADSYIGHVIRARGEDMFVVVVLKVCTDKAELDYWERRLIKSRNTKHPNGYNLTDGGEGTLGVERTPEQKAKLSEARKGKPLPLEHRQKISEAERGEKNPFFGKQHTKAAREKIADGHRKSSPYKNLLAELKAHQLLYANLAELLNVSQTSITEKMRGKKNFTARDRIKLVEIFGKPIEYLLKRDDGLEATLSNRGVSPYKNLVAELEVLNMSYTSLAKIMGLGVVSVSNKMRGKTRFTDSDKKKLAEIFGKPVEYLLQRDDG